MGIFPDPDGPSVAIDSPRHLTLRHSRRNAALSRFNANLISIEGVIPEPALKPGEEKLNSFWAPSLKAGGVHTITATQDVDPKKGDQKLHLVSKQQFYVDAPRFSLPKDSVHSVYPPPGYSEEHRILPHIVLSDPHLPWEREGKPGTARTGAERNQIPWVALITFTQDELKIPDAELTGDMFKTLATKLGPNHPVKQSSTLSVSMSVGDLKQITKTASPVTSLKNDVPGQNIDDSKADFVFMKSDLFVNIFSAYDSAGKREAPSGNYKPDTTPFQYLSHVRKINGTGMALTGVEDVGVFSVIIGNRAGPLDNAIPVTVCVHLVSIEGVAGMTFPIPADKEYVSLCSLHSWNYSVQPAQQLNVHHAFTNIGQTLDVMRPSSSLTKGLNKDNPVQGRLLSRINDGYSLVKYRTQTGEQTVGLYRGPFTPTEVASSDTLRTASTSGYDLQILDKEVGIVDITYSAAWQLGRMLALGDPSFTAALCRLRTTIHSMALKSARIRVVNEKAKVKHQTGETIARGLRAMVENLSELHLDGSSSEDAQADVPASFAPGGPRKRWRRMRLNEKNYPSLAFDAKDIEPIYQEEANKAARKLAAAMDKTRYDETNDPVSSDWMVVMAWVLNRMFLAGVPAHYLISDPSHLEPESLRFFAVDPNWVDCLIDGALSLGNHMGRDKDRIAIKIMLREYLQGTPEHQEHLPQTPRYGFYLRSDLVTMFPDLKVTTLPTITVRAPLLRHEIIADGLMLCLLDRKPGAAELTNVCFTQPPHQQRFAVAGDLTADSIALSFKRQYTVAGDLRAQDPDKKEPLDLKGEVTPTASSSLNNVFLWSSDPDNKTDPKKKTDLRMLRLPFFATYQLKLLKDYMPTGQRAGETVKLFDDDTATSALFALQLNDPAIEMTIDLTAQAAVNVRAAFAASPGDDSPPGPRAMTMLEAPQPARLIPRGPSDRTGNDDDDGDSRPGSPDHALLARTAVFERPKASSTGTAHPTISNLNTKAFPELSVAPDAPLPTHVATMDVGLTQAPTVSFAALTASEFPPPRAMGITGAASLPNFKTHAYSNLPEIPAANYVSVGSKLPQDIIFSIRVTGNFDTIYQIAEYRIQIPLGPPDPDDLKLMDNYSGPGASMLTNLRFNPLISLTKDSNKGSYMLIRLLPRSSTGSVNVLWASDLSFVLSLAEPQVVEFKKKPKKQWSVQCETLVKYKNPGTADQKGKLDIIVIKGRLEDS